MPRARLEVQQVTVIPPGEQQATLRVVSFEVQPGQAVGVIGPSGSGKSTLARAITGVWRPAGGSIRLDGATLDQYDPDVLGQHIGYLPQRVQLFDGTIAENIARLSDRSPTRPRWSPRPRRPARARDDPEAARAAMTPRSAPAGGRLSGGQIQRIGLARALYGDPVILVLDEPNSNLDNEGSQALNEAIRQMKDGGSSVLIMAHRPAAIQECDMMTTDLPSSFICRMAALSAACPRHLGWRWARPAQGSPGRHTWRAPGRCAASARPTGGCRRG